MVDGGAHSVALRAPPDLEAALSDCLDAVMTPELWPGATEAMARALGGLGCCFNPFGGGGARRLRAPMSSRYRDMFDEFISGGWATQDLRASRGWPIMKRSHGVVLESQITTPEERARLPIYNELFRRHELDLIAGLGLTVGGELWTFNLVRSREAGDFDTADVERLMLARPYLSRVLSFGEAMARSQEEGAMAALEHTATAAMQLDWTGRVVQVNAAAHAVLGTGLSVQGGHMRAEWPDAQAGLEALVAAALSADGGRAGTGGPVNVPTLDGGVLLVDAVPVRGAMTDAFGRAGVILMVTDPERRARPPERLMRSLYGLTTREAEVAARLAGGEDAGEISDALRLKASSVRQVVKTLLWKTGTRRQSDLVALLSRLPEDR